jgi:hypothetical protein
MRRDRASMDARIDVYLPDTGLVRGFLYDEQ